MTFIRTKKIKGKEYAYIVENQYRKRGNPVKQKTKKYLGRVYRFDRVNMMDFYEHYDVDDVNVYVSERSKEEIIIDLVKLELYNHGFEEEQGLWEKDGCYFDEKKMKIHNTKGNDVALAFNEGFLTSYAIKKILNFKADSEEDGFEIAKRFVEAGFAVPKEVFVGFFSKLYK